jgi:hypothetical protein
LYKKQVQTGFIDSRQDGESTYSFHFHFHDFKWSYSSTVNALAPIFYSWSLHGRTFSSADLKERDSNASSSGGKLFQNSNTSNLLYTHRIHLSELDNGSPHMFVP